MCVVDGPGDFDQHPSRLARLVGKPALGVGKAAARKERHREIVQPAMLADFQDRYHAGMIKRGDRLDLVFEPVHFLFAGESPFENHLERDHPRRAKLAGAVDDSHAAVADLIDNLVSRQIRRSKVERVTRTERSVEVFLAQVDR